MVWAQENQKFIYIDPSDEYTMENFRARFNLTADWATELTVSEGDLHMTRVLKPSTYAYVITTSFYTPVNEKQRRFHVDPKIPTNHLVYARSHGYMYDTECRRDEDVIPYPYRLIHPNYWAKIYKMWNCLEKYESASVFWIDSDAVFANISIPLSDFVFQGDGFLTRHQLNRNWSDSRLHVGCCIAASIGGSWMFNVGAVLLLNNNCSRQVLRSVVKKSSNPLYTSSSLPEQYAMNDVMRKEHPESFCVLPPSRMQSIISRGQYSSGDFVAHFTCVKPCRHLRQRESIMATLERRHRAEYAAANAEMLANPFLRLG